MIHSLAGGSFREKKILDFVKVELLDAPKAILWYLAGGFELSEGDLVLVPVGNKRTEARVLRVDKNRVEGQTPVPINRAREVIKKL